MCLCSELNIDSNEVTDSPEVKHGSARDFIKFVLVEGRGSHFWNGRIFVKNSSFLVVIPLVFSPFCCQYLLYLPKVVFCECCFLFSHLYMFFPTEWTLSILSWIIYFSRICPFFTRWEVLSLLLPPFRFERIAISFFWAINSYYFIYLLVFFPVFSSMPLCPKQEIFADILRPCETTIRHVLIVFIVSGKTPAKFVVPGLWAHG